MSEVIPLFPLSSVLLPGIPVSLHIFEERYRDLIRMLLSQPDTADRRFGVVAIRPGWEVGSNGTAALFSVGCTAELKRVSQYPDGRYDLTAVGIERFRLLEVDDTSLSYLQCHVDWLPGDAPADARSGLLANTATETFRQYLKAIATVRQEDVAEPVLPEEPTLLSYLIASTAMLTLDDKQTLLEQPTTNARLRAEITLLTREIAMLQTLRTVPVPLAELPAPQSPN